MGDRIVGFVSLIHLGKYLRLLGGRAPSARRGSLPLRAARLSSRSTPGGHPVEIRFTCAASEITAIATTLTRNHATPPQRAHERQPRAGL